MTQEKYNDGYYHLGKDLEDYPNAWCHVVWSRRGPGKTYSALRYYYERNKPIIYIKRTIEDVNLICSGKPSADGIDPSPYVPLNRDFGWNIKPVIIDKGIGAFYNFSIDEDNPEPVGAPVAYVFALSGIKKIKGIELSICDAIIFDEFIPQVGEIVRHGTIEGDQLLSLVMTAQRDRPKRGLAPTKLILFANAEEISTPITNTLEIVDDMADMNAYGRAHMYLEDREIHLHYITLDEIPLTEAEKHGIFKGMLGTAWHQKTFEGSFASNDFTNVMKLSLKGCKPLIHIHYKQKDMYIYINPQTGLYYMCNSKNKCIFDYDLNRENEQKSFWVEHCIDLRSACIDDKFKFEKYSMYDLIINYKKFFKV